MKLPAAKAKLIRDLARHKAVRDRERTLVLEGEKPIGELLREPAPLLALIVADSRLARRDALLRQALAQAATPVYACRDSAFDTLSDVRTPSGLLALVSQPVWNQEAILARPEVLGLYGEMLQDPTNVGTVIRSALAFGLDAVWLSAESADVFNPKVVRASAGAVLKLPVFSLQDLAVLLQHRCAVYAAEAGPRKGRPIHSLTSLPPRTIVALGNESRGLAPETLDRATATFYIPIVPELESLNVAAAAAVAAFYFSSLRKSPLP